MIRLIGILTEGGVPIRINSYVETEGEMLIGALISAAKTLCEAMGSGEVRKLAFKDNTLIVTESKKHYTIVALVDKAEDYMDTLLRVISDELDESEIPQADGSVMDLHTEIVDDILDIYIKKHVESTLSELISDVWPKIVESIKQNPQLKEIIDGIDEERVHPEVDTKWLALKSKIAPSISNALNYAVVGEFDYACAASIDIDDDIAKIFAIKMGTLARSMTNTSVPPVRELQNVAKSLTSNDSFSNLARNLMGYLARETLESEYSEAFRIAIDDFEFVKDQKHFLLAFLFLDYRISNYSTFAQDLIKYFDGKSDIAKNYVYSIVDRDAIFGMLYSVSSYDDFKKTLGVYKQRIAEIKTQIKSVLKTRIVRKLLRSDGASELALQGSLQLQNYITLLTALAESPVLTISERKEVIEEVIELYWDYFRKLLKMKVPLFAHSIDSIFQSLSVACSEYYLLATGNTRQLHLKRIREFLRDIVDVMAGEWEKAQVRFSISVVTNAIGPVINRAGEFWDEEVYLTYAAMSLLDIESQETLRESDPEMYVTNFNNIGASLISIVSRLLTGETRTEALVSCVTKTIAAQNWFLSHGIICRDDIIATTYHASLIAGLVDDDILKRALTIMIALNRVAVQDPVKYDYELAMVGSSLITLLVKGWEHLKDPRYLDMAKDTLKMCTTALRKYGFYEKADNIENHFKHI